MIFKAGLIGCGRIGSSLSEDRLREKPCTHAESYVENPSVQLVAGCDLDSETLSVFASKWNVKNLYEDYNEMLEKEKLDIVSIATDINTHIDIIEACVNAKVKVIFCEKPLTSDIKEGERIVNLCKKNNTLLIINHTRRFSGDYIKVRDLLRSSVIGKIKSIYCTLSTRGPEAEETYEQNGGGALLHDGTHLIDTLRFLMDDTNPSEILTQLNMPSNGAKVEQNLLSILTYQDNIKVIVDSSDRDYFHFEIDIHGDKGRILIGNGIHHYFIKSESQYYENFNSLIEKQFPDYSNVPAFSNAIESIVKFLKTGEIPESTGLQALETLKVIMAIYKSGVNNKKIAYPIKITSNPLEKLFQE